MKRYAAFLRGVSPMNAKMPELKKAFEAAGFTDVKTVLSSGNVVFSAPGAPQAALEHKAEAAMQKSLGSAFATIVRPIEVLRRILDSDPYEGFRLKPGAKRVVTFLRLEPKARIKLPPELDGARILRIQDGEVFSAYVPGPRGPVFMTLIEKTFGKDVTDRKSTRLNSSHSQISYAVFCLKKKKQSRDTDGVRARRAARAACRARAVRSHRRGERRARLRAGVQAGPHRR